MLAPFKKSYDLPDNILKSRDITFLTKVHLVKAMVFPVAMYECESWIIKQAEHQRTDTFELWCWRRLLRVPWLAGRSNQSVLKKINPECSLTGLMGYVSLLSKDSLLQHHNSKASALQCSVFFMVQLSHP